jgi:hypothetical protein
MTVVRPRLFDHRNGGQRRRIAGSHGKPGRVREELFEAGPIPPIVLDDGHTERRGGHMRLK